MKFKVKGNVDLRNVNCFEIWNVKFCVGLRFKLFDSTWKGLCKTDCRLKMTNEG